MNGLVYGLAQHKASKCPKEMSCSQVSQSPGRAYLLRSVKAVNFIQKQDCFPSNEFLNQFLERMAPKYLPCGESKGVSGLFEDSSNFSYTCNSRAELLE